MMPQTPGPWHTGGIGISANGRRSMSVWGPTPEGAQSGEWIAKDVRPANAALIAAAPDMLTLLEDALEYFVATLSPCEPDCECFIHLTRAVIAKAKGHQSVEVP